MTYAITLILAIQCLGAVELYRIHKKRNIESEEHKRGIHR